jgi:branched-chain amino acid transport system permease protein
MNRRLPSSQPRSRPRKSSPLPGVLGALVLFGLQEALSSYGAWYLVIVGGLAVAATLVSPRGLWGFAADRFGWSLLPVGYRVRPPQG